MLPFAWIIFSLAFGFGAGLVTKQRALVAARELVLRQTMSRCVERNGHEPGVRADVLTPRSVSGTFRVNAGRNAATNSLDVQGFGWIRSFMSQLSGSHRVTFNGRGVQASPLLRNPAVASAFRVDSDTWTYHRYPGGYWSFLTSSLPMLCAFPGVCSSTPNLESCR